MNDASDSQDHRADPQALLAMWNRPPKILRLATSQNAELIASCGPRNPFPGKLGVLQEDARADLLLGNRNPLENMDLVADPDANFTVIMKAATVDESTIARQAAPLECREKVGSPNSSSHPPVFT